MAANHFGDEMLMSWKAERQRGREEIEEIEELVPTKSRRVILATCPDYGNLGDQAIAYAERLFITKRVRCPVVVLCGPLQRQWKALLEDIRPGDLICLQGGGSLGTLYECYENERLAIIDRFKGNKIILFPHTFSYGDTKYERRYLQHMRAVYNRHPDLHLIAREQMSFDRMKEHFPNADVLLTPDIALSIPPISYTERERNGIYLCLREDKERKMPFSGFEIIAAAAEKSNDMVVQTSTMHPSNVLTPDEGEAAVREKISEFSHAQLVVTDRIHGMIFCALSGTPCIALDNATGKVRHEYEWLKDLPYMHFARSAEEAAGMILGAEFSPGRFPSEEFMPLFSPIEALLSGGCHGQV